MTRYTPYLLTVAAALLLACVSPASAQSMKIGVVDLEQIVDGYKAAQTREVEMNKQREALSTQIQNMQNRGMEMIKDLENLRKELVSIQSDTTLSDQAKQEKIKAPSEALQRKADQVRKFGKDLEEYRDSETKKLTDNFVAMNNDIVLQVAAAVRNYAQKNGYDFVFNQNKKSPASSDIVYAGKGEDITVKVIEYINSLPVEQPAAAAAGS